MLHIWYLEFDIEMTGIWHGYDMKMANWHGTRQLEILIGYDMNMYVKL